MVLSGEEIVRFLEAVPGLRNRVALTTAYAAGLRVGEVARLKAAAIDSERMLIRIENGKGGKDRYAMLSPQLLGSCAPIGGWRGRGRGCFLARSRREPVSVAALQAACRPAARARGTEQAGHGPHAAAQLRHPSSGERDRHPHHPGSARPRQTCRRRRAIPRSPPT